MKTTNTMEDFLQRDYEKWGERPYLHEKKNDVERVLTFGEFICQVNYFATYLLQCGYAGKNIGIFSPNSLEWMIADIAVMNYVGVSAGFNKDWNYENMVYALRKCDIACLLYHEDFEALVQRAKEEYPELQAVRFLCIQREFTACVEAGKREMKELFSLSPQSDEVPAKIVFTSGSTSFPKAVLLSIKNVFAGWRSLGRRVPLNEQDVCYLFLPLNHTYGSIFNFIYSLVFGYQVYLAESIPNMAQEMMAIKPTVFSGVPVVYTRFYEGAKAAGIGLRALFGGRMKYLFCGGAKLGVEMRRDYLAEGMYMMNAYALSETASSFSIDYPDDEDMESVGTVFEDITVKVLEPDAEGYGELAVAGDNMFLGYYKDEAATKAAFAGDGYFLTGDIGCIRENRVYLRGRKDTQIALANGEKVSVTMLEGKVKALHESVRSVKLYVRDGQLTADVYVDAGTVGAEAAEWDSFYGALLEKCNESLPKYQRIAKWNVYDAARLLK
ncbi:MAG: AMP-binding protein [Lachnospiraceae bacterium]|nr:AMP-binding protein [Lachnospiraceae bacterium]